jgi:hypothetical protein
MIRRWFTQHQSIIALLGALIVFSTYITNEVLHDRYSGLADALDKAETTSVLRNDIAGIGNLLGQVQTDLLILKQDRANSSQSAEARPPGTLAMDDLERKISVDRFQIAHIETITDTIERLSGHFPLTERERSDLASVKWMSQALSRSEDAEMEQVDGKIPSVNAAALLSDDWEFAKLFTQYRFSSPLGIATRVYDGILARAEARRKIQERQSARWKDWSILLYSVGWGLGLLGKLFEDKQARATELSV